MQFAVSAGRSTDPCCASRSAHYRFGPRRCLPQYRRCTVICPKAAAVREAPTLGGSAGSTSDPELDDVDEEALEWQLQDLEEQEVAIRQQREELQLKLLKVSQNRALKKQQDIYRESAATAAAKAKRTAGYSDAKVKARRRKARGKRKGRMGSMAALAATERKAATLAEKRRAMEEHGSSVQLSSLHTSLDEGDPLASVHVIPGEHPHPHPVVLPKPIFVLSDCTGESAARTVKAGLGQFEEYSKMSVPANLVIFRFLSDEKKVYGIVQRASEEGALVVYTLVDPAMLKAVKTACQLFSVKSLDLWGDVLDIMEDHLQQVRMGVPLGQRNRSEQLSDDYFRMIEAVEYTRKMDDGANPDQWKGCDLLLLGVSRSGKTPLSIYLGQRGYKVANLPLVAGIPPPRQLLEIDQRKVVGLIIDSQLLAQVRATRMGNLGVDMGAVDYADMNEIRKELEWAQSLYAQHPTWPVLDVTFKGVEETAARILRIMSDRYGDLHPMWAEGYSSLLSG